MPKTYFAHTGHDKSGRDTSDWQPLREHLVGVAELAASFASTARPGDEYFQKAATLAGLLHDLGKYRETFQQYLRGLLPRSEQTRHKLTGAAKASALGLVDVTYAIAGHHGGLPDKVALKSDLSADTGARSLDAIWAIAIHDFPSLAQLPTIVPARLARLDGELLTRLLFSCLVDADWSDTSRHDLATRNLSESTPSVLEPDHRLQTLLAHLAALAARSDLDPIVRLARSEVLEACLSASALPPGVFSLEVPTGGGKTLASLAFALKHAATHGLRRVIYVAPYLTIIEQNASAIRAALSLSEADTNTFFEHHSFAEPIVSENDDEAETARATRIAENWSSPFVITTNVQFFESLFARTTTACRKLHNIARSVVILDECQTLPPGYIAPTCQMLEGLANHLGTTIVLATATQPAWAKRPDFTDGISNIRPIVVPELRLFDRLRRVQVSFPKSDTAPWSWHDLAASMGEHSACLSVVNTRGAAAAVYSELKALGIDGALHLSTRMCPVHRLAVVAEVRRRLSKQLPCRLISTQLIQAGVDLDFPIVFREFGPLEDIIQSAGRCNREGKRNHPDGTPGGTSIVFRSQEGSLPPDSWYRAGTATLDTMLAADCVPDIHDPDDVRAYFARLYKAGLLDQKGITRSREQAAFRKVHEAYKLIDAATFPVVVTTWPEHASAVNDLLNELESTPRRSVLRRLGRYQVNLYEFERSVAAPYLAQGPIGLTLWLGDYDAALGLCFANNQSLWFV